MEQAELAYRDEIAGRRRIDASPVVGEVRAPGKVPALPGGGMIIACGHSDSTLIKTMLHAVDTGDAAIAGGAVASHVKSSSKRLPPAPSLAKVRARVRNVPVYADVTYAGKFLAEGMALTARVPATVAVLPFAGGAVQSGRFVTGLYASSPAAAAAVKTVIVYRAPALTPLEERIVASVPAEDFNELVGGNEREVRPPVIDVYCHTFEFHFHLYIGALVSPNPKDLNGGDLQPWLADPKHAALLKGVSPTAAVGTLLAARRELLRANIIKL
jgi:hypothetical protein